MDRKHYLLNWGINFTEEEKPKKILGRPTNKPRTHISDEYRQTSTMLTENGFQPSVKRVVPAPTILPGNLYLKRKNIPNTTMHNKGHMNYQGFQQHNTRIPIGPGVRHNLKYGKIYREVPKKEKKVARKSKYDDFREVDLIQKNDSTPTTDNSETDSESYININDHNVLYNSHVETNIPHINHESPKFPHQEPHGLSEIDTDKAMEKVKQIPYLRDFFMLNPENEAIPVTSIMKSLNKSGTLHSVQSNTMEAYILLDAENIEHRHYGYIYLDEVTKVSNHHFHNFRPEKYIRSEQANGLEGKTPGKISEANVESDSENGDTCTSVDKIPELINIESEFDMYINPVNFRGTWDAGTNVPEIPLDDTSVKPGEFYIVVNPGNTEINGINKWETGSAIIYVDNKGWTKSGGMST